MKKIINKNRSRLVFPKYDLVLEPDEIKEITEEIFDGIIQNASIEEVLHESLKKEETVEKDKSIKKVKVAKRKFINH